MYQSDLKDKDWEMIKEFFNRTDPRGKKNKYEIKTITDPDAKNMLKNACSLWNYNFPD